jgi:hypothetical protein
MSNYAINSLLHKIINQSVVLVLVFLGLTNRSLVLGGSSSLSISTFCLPFTSAPFFFVLSRILIFFSLSLLLSVEKPQQNLTRMIVMIRTE